MSMTEEGKKVLQFWMKKRFHMNVWNMNLFIRWKRYRKRILWHHKDGIGAKNLFLRDGSGKRHFLVVIRDDKQADLKQVRAEIKSSRLSFCVRGTSGTVSSRIARIGISSWNSE